MTINYFIKSFNKQNNHLTSEMVILEDNTNLPKYALREIKNEPAVKVFCYYNYDEKIKEYGIRYIDDLEGMYTNFLYYHRNEKLQKLLNEGKLYLHILRTVARVKKAVNEQVKLWEQNDNELQLALRNGDTDTYYGLMSNLKARAEEVILPTMLYV